MTDLTCRFQSTIDASYTHKQSPRPYLNLQGSVSLDERGLAAMVQPRIATARGFDDWAEMLYSPIAI